jgi:NCAIR mutase (PurE)-related protein
MRSCRKFLGIGTIFMLSFLVLFPQQLRAEQEHLVTAQDLQSALNSKQDARAENLATMQNFLSDRKVERVVKQYGADPVQVKQAVASLSDEELASLATQVQTSHADFAAGRLSHADLKLIVIAIVIIVIVVALAD